MYVEIGGLSENTWTLSEDYVVATCCAAIIASYSDFPSSYSCPLSSLTQVHECASAQFPHLALRGVLAALDFECVKQYIRTLVVCVARGVACVLFGDVKLCDVGGVRVRL